MLEVKLEEVEMNGRSDGVDVDVESVWSGLWWWWTDMAAGVTSSA